jgi:hypothetical protein
MRIGSIILEPTRRDDEPLTPNEMHAVEAMVTHLTDIAQQLGRANTVGDVRTLSASIEVLDAAPDA